MRPIVSATACLAVASVSFAAAVRPAAQPFTIEDLMNVRRLSDPQVSPDGHHVAFVLRETDVGANRGRTDIWLLELGARDAEPRRLTRTADDDSNPRWAPDSRTLYFLSERSGSSQVWRLTLEGGEAIRVSDYPLDVSALELSPRGDRLAFGMEVFPDCRTLACTRERLAAAEKSDASGRIYDRLFVRHWDTWKNGTRSHLFSAAVSPDGTAGAPVDLSDALDADVPSKPFGAAEEFAFSPDGQRIVFSARVAGRTEPWSTNFDLYEVAADGTGTPRNLTADNPAWDAQPVFLPNGDLAWLAMERPGFEADRFGVRLRGSDGKVRSLAASWDRSVSRLAALPGGRQLLATTDDLGQHALYSIDVRSGTPRRLVETGQVMDYSGGEDAIVFAWASLGEPADLYRVRASGGEPQRLTSLNRALLAERSLGTYERFTFKGANDETVHGYVVRPHDFQAGKRYPVAFFVHGGPQSSFLNQWSYRWNPQVFAGAGYAFVTIDFHGSPGYGQAFTDSVSGDWGGKAVEDLQKGLAAVLARHAWLDENRICALGASYGGFMMNWLAGNWSEPFRCLVNHAGIFDQRAFYYSTEELWFPEWDFGGPYFKNPQRYEQWNPANFVTSWRVPMLVTHGQLDFRVPYTQGLSAFTALQRRGIESRLVVFPDENHWVLKPSNAIQWYREMLAWLDRHLKSIERD
jgi:dipeptidyl aminopeptidase/acylaminoacyl peptidase